MVRKWIARVCPWCNRWWTGTKWFPIGISTKKFFTDTHAEITHGMCNHCNKEMNKELDEMENRKK